MKKILLSLFIILSFTFYVLSQKIKFEDNETRVVIPFTPPVNTIQTPSKYKDGEYTGIVADAYYGPMQIKTIIQNGKIIDVQFLQYPNDRRTSVEINTQALPYLKQEAIAAQDANVDTVTGATQSSRGFKETLQSALDQAKN